MNLFGNIVKSSSIDRSAALNACPIRTNAVKVEEKKEKVYVTVLFQRPKWQRWLGAEEECRRSFGLDKYGAEVYHACDGDTPVRKIVDKFARNHKLSIAEAEMSVSTFIQTLLIKGLIVMEVQKK
ncbi:MAG TPA: hypothetical protein DCZ94_16025 [Lentisphaeria bacterium]|nr:MAG: hypothetical protein A2X48_01270 [Lentisphaerae bacterium GWF2_49_21]HBC88456.1 hypothetical protein [Lentisphaeria bacterium]